MRRANLFALALPLGAMVVPGSGAQAQPTAITACQTINNPGAYELEADLSSTGNCLVITANYVSIDLAGFTISGSPASPNSSTAILAMPPSGQVLTGLAVRNGSISAFGTGVNLGSGDSIVEGLRVFGGGPVQFGIIATGVVKDNIVVDIAGLPGQGVGISAAGIITGNYVTNSRNTGMEIGQGSTVIGNTVTDSFDPGIGISVSCPSNVTNNTAVNNHTANLVPNGTGCNDTNNVAP
jgi:hypothetical protein